MGNKERAPMLCCPVCGKVLVRQAGTFRCPNGHSFDRAREGYVNLLAAKEKHSAHPGDTKEMVRSRRLFLESGHYRLFAEQLAQLAARALEGAANPQVLDIGCGEGYYTRFLKQAAGVESTLFGFDISKWAARLAAKRNPDCTIAVASAFHMPVADQSVDLAVNVFAPLVPEEIVRVLRPGGRLLYAVPGPRHLYGLKQVLYDNPYENEVKETAYPGLAFLERVPVQGRIRLTDPAEIQALFAMTPYYWKTPKAGADRLRQSTLLETEIEFAFLLYQK